MNNPKSFKKFKKVPLLAAAAFLALALAAFFWTHREIGENKLLAEAARQEWQNEEARRYEVRSLDILLRDIQAERREIDSYFATTANVVPFLDSLEELARATGAKPEVVAVDTSKDGQELTATLRAEGSFEEIYKFLELLENSPYELDMLSVDIGKTGTEESEGWEGFFKMKLVTFMP